MNAVLRRRGDTCLVRAIVAQTWEAAHGRRRDVIIGVTAPGEFRAHAWLDDERQDAPSSPAGTQGFEWSGAIESDDLHTRASDAEFHALLRVPMPR